MRKYFISFLAITLCFAAYADQGTTPQLHPKAQEFATQAKAFVAEYSADMPNINTTLYNSGIDTIAAGIPANANLADFDVTGYMSGLTDKVDDMLRAFNEAGNSGTLKTEYLEEVANYFVKEYGEDLKRGFTDVEPGIYLEDLARLNTNYQSRLDILNTPAPSGSTVGFNPENYLDRATGETRRDVQIEFFWGGVSNTWANYNLVALVNAFQQTFSHDSVAQNDFQFLKDLWPQSAEAYLMNTAYNENDYSTVWDNEYYIQQNGENIGRSVVLNEYGMPSDEEGSEQFNVGNSTSVVTASFYGRNWGYVNRPEGYRGTIDLVTITTNGRKYTLQEDLYISPLVLDMDGDGAIEASRGKWLPHRYEKARLAEFDITGDGFMEITEWVGPNDGLLIAYNGQKEVSANDLFGTAGGYDHGYEKLSLLDANNDKKLTGAELATLSVWQDANGNAKVDDGEVKSLQDLGITTIGVENDENLVSSFVQRGVTKRLVDWYPCVFSVKKRK